MTQRRKKILKPTMSGYRFIVKMIFIFLLITISFPALSQPDSLRKYITIAVRDNPSMQQKFTQYQAALQKVPQAGALPDPQLNVSYFLMPMELVNGKQIADMNLMQMFPWFGVLKNAKDEMSFMALARFEEYRETGLQLAYDVQSTWYEIYRIRKTADITRRNRMILKSIEDIALTRYKAASAGSNGSVNMPAQRPSSPGSAAQPGSSMQGMSGGQAGAGAPASQPSMPMTGNQMDRSAGSDLADLYRLKMEAADLQNALNNLADEEKTLTARFNILLNRPEDNFIYVPDSLGIDSLLQIPSPGTGVFGDNPMLGMAEYEQKAYAAREKMSKKMGLPMVGLGIGYSIVGSNEMAQPEMNGKDMVMPMVSVTIPIWRKKYRSMQQEAALLAESADHQYMSISNDLETEYYEASRNYRDALRRVDLYIEQKELASNTLDLMRTRFSVSSAGLTDILRVQQQLLDYEISEAEAVSGLHRAIAQLKRIMATSINEINLKNTE